MFQKHYKNPSKFIQNNFSSKHLSTQQQQMFYKQNLIFFIFILLVKLQQNVYNAANVLNRGNNKGRQHRAATGEDDDYKR